MQALCDLAARTGIYVISDEIYRGLEWSGAALARGRQSLRAGRDDKQRFQDARHERHAPRLVGIPGSRRRRAVPQSQVLHDAPPAEPARRDRRHGRAWSQQDTGSSCAAPWMRRDQTLRPFPVGWTAMASSAGFPRRVGSSRSHPTISTFPPGTCASASSRSPTAPTSFRVAATDTRGMCALDSDRALLFRPLRRVCEQIDRFVADYREETRSLAATA